MNRILVVIAIGTGLYLPFSAAAKGRSLEYITVQQQEQQKVSGKVIHQGKPVRGATVRLKELELFAMTDAEGTFVFPNVPVGNYTLQVQYTGMKPIEVKAITGAKPVEIALIENSIALEDIQVVGQVSNVKGATSTYISRQAIEHLQATNLGELLQLLPGQKKIGNPSFSGVNKPLIRQMGDVNGDNVAAMGTAVIINGAQLSNNADLQAANTARGGVLSNFSNSTGMGTDLRQLSADNVESVEVIRGIPSVEYGDLTSGILDVKTKAAVEPLQAKFRLNPTMRQAWLGQGFSTGKNGGALFVDVDYTHASDKQIQTSESYQRINTSLQYTHTVGRNKNLYTNTNLSFGGILITAELIRI